MDIFGHFYLNHLSPLWGYFLTLLQMVEVHLLLMYCIKNLSIDVAYSALLNLFWISEYVTSELFAGQLSADCPDVGKSF